MADDLPEPGVSLVRSPLRSAFDVLLIVALFAAYYPQSRATLSNHNPATKLPRSYVLLTLLFVTFLNTSHMTGLAIFCYNPHCVPLGFGDFFTWTGFRVMLDVAQTGALWWCEFIVSICWIVASRPSARRTPTLVSSSRGFEDEEEDAETAALLDETEDSSGTDSVFGREISPTQSFYLNIASVAAIWCLSTGLYVIAHQLSTHDPAVHQRVGVPFFITLRVLTMLTFPLMFVPVVVRLRGGKGTGMEKRGLVAQSVVLLLIGISLAQMADKRQGGMHDARQLGMALWMEGAVSVLALAGVRGGVAWLVGRREGDGAVNL